MAGLSIGATEIKKVSLGDVEVKKISLGDTLIWSASTPTPMGIDKSGPQTLAASTWVPLTGWTVRSGYPLTVTSGAGILLPPGTYNYTARGTFQADNSFTNTQQIRLLRGATVVGTGSNPSSDGVSALTGQLTVAEESVMTLEGFANDAAFGRNVVSAGATSTYLYFDLA